MARQWLLLAASLALLAQCEGLRYFGWTRGDGILLNSDITDRCSRNDCKDHHGCQRLCDTVR